MATIRVRTKAGVWRFKEVNLGQKMSDLVGRIQEEQKVIVKKVSLKQNFSDEVDTAKTLKQLGLKNGTMIYV